MTTRVITAPDQEIKAALDTHATGDLSGAVKALLHLLERHPGYLPALRPLARLALDNRQWELAQDASRALLEISPEDGMALSVHARAAVRLNQKEAGTTVRELEAIAERDDEAARGRALLSLDLKEGAGCLPWLDKALRLNPGNTIALALRASVYVRLRRYDEAINDYASVIAIAPEQIRARMGRARLASMQGDFRTAEADYNSVLDRAPAYAPALMHNDRPLPILVCGLPRSGTSLVE